jgi:hypothetical protein
LTVSRRVFLRRDELAGLLRGALVGEPTALRRILGARLAGRFGFALWGVGLLLAVPRPELVGMVAWHAALSLAVWSWARARETRLREVLRLSTWPVGVLLLVAGPLRWLDPTPWAPVLAIAAGHLLLVRGLRRLYA